MNKTTVHVRITGRVQGVFYRDWTVGEARSRGVSGWVRNCRDGSVEAVFSGEDAAVQAMVDACKTGSRAARVERVEVSPAEAGDLPDRFEKRPTL